MTQPLRSVLPLVIGLAVILALLGAGSLLPALVAPSEPEYATTETWHVSLADPPPQGSPILGLWCETMYERSHVVEMFGSQAFEYGPPETRVQILETRAPDLWRRLP
jgi:hypothetical protein